MSHLTITSFKEAMSSIASQVMILTASHPLIHPTTQSSPPPTSFKGVTLSSVTSLSINPHPLIQFNLMTPSTTSYNLHNHKLFALHILSPTLQSVEMAKLFSTNKRLNNKTNTFESYTPFEELKLEKDYRLLEQDGIQLPILTQVEKILICSTHKIFNVQDHEIWIGKVEEIINQTKGKNKTGGLLNYNRNFHIIGDKV